MGESPTYRQSKTIVLHIHVIWIHNILPPVVMNAVDPPGSFRKMGEPPEVMLARVAIAPIAGSDLASHALEVGEVIQPVIAFTDDSG